MRRFNGHSISPFTSTCRVCGITAKQLMQDRNRECYQGDNIVSLDHARFCKRFSDILADTIDQELNPCST